VEIKKIKTKERQSLTLELCYTCSQSSAFVATIKSNNSRPVLLSCDAIISFEKAA